MLIGLLLVLSAVAITVDAARAPLVMIVLLSISARPLYDAWRAVRGTALRPALVWAFLALALAVIAQTTALTEPLAQGRPLAERFTYLSVLALLAALGSVLNARTPGGKAWAGLMVVLVVVFLIPWLEDQTRLRRASALAQLHLDAPWSIFYGLLVVVAVTNYLPTRYGLAALSLSVLFILEYLALSPLGWPPARRALVWSWVAWALALSAWIARWNAQRIPAPPSSSSCEKLWFWFRDNWGVVWALRVLERFNRAAEVSRWPVRLTWFGLLTVTGQEGAGPPPSSAETEATFRNLMKRFAEPWRLDEVTHSGKPPAQVPHT
jgi:UDP-N-acetylmuramyl pentapeptide phosphotransferase/UDP-N-acetylglucosamine-1-phosphate transferase